MSNINVYKDTNITLEMLEDRGIMKKNNLTARAAPSNSAAVADSGYRVGSLWLNTAATSTSDRVYVCSHAEVTGTTVSIRWFQIGVPTAATLPA